jgi:SAM-dependent methyltransferase
VATDPSLDAFLNPRCSLEMLDTFGIRSHILAAVREEAANFRGTLLDIGCGYMPYKSIVTAPPAKVERYIGMDFEGNKYLAGRVDLTWDGRNIPLPDASVDCAMATEFFEHSSDPAHVMRETMRVLRPEGRLFLTAPFLWPLHEVPYDECRYTPFHLERLLAGAGFGEIRVRALGGWDSALAQMIGLWVSYRGFSNRNKWVLSRLALPVMKMLHRLDRPPAKFKNMTMMSGLTATAIKPASSA